MKYSATKRSYQHITLKDFVMMLPLIMLTWKSVAQGKAIIPLHSCQTVMEVCEEEDNVGQLCICRRH